MHVGIVIAILAGVVMAVPAFAQNACSWQHDLRLVNGRIHTEDSENRVVSQVTIQDGRFAFVGPVGNHQLSPCTKVINLHGRTVVPGLIDNQNHFILFSLRPGHEIQLETATTIPQAMALLKHRAETTPAGGWVTTIGDWLPRQFKEDRDPTLAELDRAVPHHPVLLVRGFGPCITNSLGKKFFESNGIAVSANGVIAPGDPTWKALAALRKMWTLQDEIGGTEYAQSYMLRYGVTTSLAMSFWALPGSPHLEDDMTVQSIASLDPWTAYKVLLALDREHELNERVRIFFIRQDKQMSLPLLHQLLLNVFPNFGDNMLRVSGIGEFASPWFRLPGQLNQKPANFEAALELIARHGWMDRQHSLSVTEVDFTADTFAKVNKVIPIAKLHWSIAHVPNIDPQRLKEMKSIGVGLALISWRYLAGDQPNGPFGQPLPAGPPYRTILASGIHAGEGSDAGDFAILDPWFNLYYMVTGKDCTGALINPGQTITRQQAMKLYTADNSWFIPDGKDLGSIQRGKLGDLVVLSADYFNPRKVSDEQIKQLKSVLTVVGGRIVYNDLH